MRILINGIGRIGKSILRIAQKDKNIQIVAINDINPCKENIVYTINYDTTYGKIKNKFKIQNDYLINKTNKIKILNEKKLEDIDYKNLKIDYIIDSSGVKQDINILNKIPVKKIFLTHPNKDTHINVILGVNEDKITSKDKIISTSSCNATALLPVLKILDKNYEIKFGEINTIHPLLNHQKVLDGSCIKSSTRDVACNFEFGRSALENVIPSKTTTIDACSYIMPHINSDIFSSSSLRVPTQTVGAIDISLYIKKKTSKEKVIKLLQKEEKKQKSKIIQNNFEKLVSSDFKKLKYNCAIDHRFTDVKKDKMIKMIIWYDNEYSYALKVLQSLKFCAK